VTDRHAALAVTFSRTFAPLVVLVGVVAFVARLTAAGVHLASGVSASLRPRA